MLIFSIPRIGTLNDCMYLNSCLFNHLNLIITGIDKNWKCEEVQ